MLVCVIYIQLFSVLLLAGLRVVGLYIMTIVDTSTVLNLEEEENIKYSAIIAPYMYNGARPCST